MRLFDKLRRTTDTEAIERRPASADVALDEGVDAAEAAAPPVTTVPSPSRPTSAATATTEPAPDPGRYDPSHPCHAPVAGVDLVRFAQITHRLRVAPSGERRTLLAEHGHTAESWSAVNTVWMARLGQMPYLCTTFDEASRLA